MIFVNLNPEKQKPMNYQTFEPGDSLKPFVKCYWTLESPGEETPQKQTIVPDGCMEMIFHYGDLYRQYTTLGSTITQPRCFVIGQLSGPLQIEPTGTTGIFAVRFQPDGFVPLADIRVKEMEDTAVSLEKLFGAAGRELETIILSTRTTPERIKHIETFLLGRLAADETVDRIVKSAVETIVTANGQLSVDEISKCANINRRQLERKFSATIGLSPKQLSKTVRLQTALKMLLAKKFTSLTALAYENEYYDQAHFIKDFRELTGLTPKEFYGNNLKMSALFYGTD